MNVEQLQLIHEAIVEGDWVQAANLALIADDIDATVSEQGEAIQLLQQLEKNLADEAKYMEIAVLLWGNGMFDSRPSVVREVFDAVQKNSKLIIFGGSSLSKCLGPDVGVRMFDGSIKPAKDVKMGDVLMGDDSRPRNVLAAHSGTGPLYKIHPYRGKPWTCNDEHILSLRVGGYRKTHGRPSKKWVKGDVHDIPIKEYMGFSNYRKRCLMQFSVGVDYGETKQEYDPYIYGAWLGDGSSKTGCLSSPRCALTKKWASYFESIGMFVREYPHATAKCSSWTVSSYEKKGAYKTKRNPWTKFIRSSINDSGKFIRPEYLFSTRKSRLSTLAGIIDTDGCVIDDGTAFIIAAVPGQLANQIFHLARSLGFGSQIRKMKQSGKIDKWYHVITVSGVGIEKIPTLDKKLSRVSKRMTSNVGIKKIEEIGNGKYYGFLIDGNHRFLLEDYTVTHNTFSCGVWFYLAWRSDPYWTAVKLAAPSEDHLYTNLFSHLVALHKGAVIPMTDDDAKKVNVNESDLFISMSDALPEMRIQGVLCKQSQISAGALRGHKPKPYRKPLHPKYGNSTRIFILIDECTQVSPGAFEDIKTTEASIDEKMDNVKIVMPCNPEGITYKIVQMAEPEEGWDIEQVDTLYSWTSKQGYPVLRLDGKRFENVVQRKTIYPRMLTYDAFLGFLKAGEHSSQYWAKGRGFPPLKDNAWTIIPPAWMQSQRGEPIYTGTVENIGILDTALAGSDKALWGVGRWGEAAGWRKSSGETEWFVNRANPDQRIKKHVAVLDQIFQLAKTANTVEVVQEVMGRSKQMGISAENTIMDRAQPIDEPVLTPNGWKPIGELKVGDKVIGSSGLPVSVTGVFNRGRLPIMRAVFNDGSWTRCASDHLWSIQHVVQSGSRIVTTESIKSYIDSGKVGWTYIPMLESPAQFSDVGTLPIDPYLLGCLLGDGDMGKYRVRFSTADAEMLDNVRLCLPSGMAINHEGHYSYNLYSPGYKRAENGRDFAAGKNPLLNAVRSLGLAGSYCHNKFIPECYMKASPEDRLALIQGLMDTDGYVNRAGTKEKTCSAGIRLTSEKMIRQIIEICESLGGWGSYRTHQPKPENGRPRMRAHVATIGLPDNMLRFRLSRKVAQLEPRKYEFRRKFKRIDNDGEAECVCIRVDAHDHLYATRHCILTHNTGNAAGVWSHAKKFWGDVLGIEFGSRSSEDRILSDDQVTAYDICDGKVTELWIATKKWMEPVVGALLINPIVPSSPLFTQITTRRYRNVKGGRMRVEPKEEYRARNAGVSPDEADILCLLVEWCRQRGKVLPGIMEAKKEDSSRDFERVSLKNADEPDSLSGSDKWEGNALEADN